MYNLLFDNIANNYENFTNPKVNEFPIDFPPMLIYHEIIDE